MKIREMQILSEEEAVKRIQKKLMFKYYWHYYKVSLKKKDYQVEGHVRLGKKNNDVWISVQTIHPNHHRYFYILKNTNFRKVHLEKSVLIMKNLKFKAEKGIYLDLNKVKSLLQGPVEEALVRKYAKVYVEKGIQKQVLLDAIWNQQTDEIIINSSQGEEIQLQEFKQKLNNKVPKNQLIPHTEQIIKNILIESNKMYYYSYEQNQKVIIIQKYWKSEKIYSKYSFQLLAPQQNNNKRCIKKGEVQVIRCGYNWAIKLYTQEEDSVPDSKLITDKIVLNKLNKQERIQLLKNLVYMVQSNTFLQQTQDNYQIKFIDRDLFQQQITIKFIDNLGQIGDSRLITLSKNN